jgi:hypothetical protein
VLIAVLPVFGPVPQPGAGHAAWAVDAGPEDTGLVAPSPATGLDPAGELAAGPVAGWLVRPAQPPAVSMATMPSMTQADEDRMLTKTLHVRGADTAKTRGPAPAFAPRGRVSRRPARRSVVGMDDPARQAEAIVAYAEAVGEVLANVRAARVAGGFAELTDAEFEQLADAVAALEPADVAVLLAVGELNKAGKLPLILADLRDRIADHPDSG